METIAYQQLESCYQKALEAAHGVLNTAYNPYSHFHVAACLVTEDDTLITGTNVENAAYFSICAERAAILRANVMGRRCFKGIAIITCGPNGADTPTASAPCGSCRQSLYEVAQIAGNNLTVILSNTQKTHIIRTSIEELLPLPFGPRDVGVDVAHYRR